MIVAVHHGGVWPWVKTKELTDVWIDDTEEHITDEAVACSSAKVLPIHTLLVALYGATVGQLGILRREMTCNQACCAIIVNEDEGHFRYIYYQLLAARQQLKRLATGAAQQNLSGDLIKKFQLPFPSVPEQRAIAHILGTLDDKIEMNQRMNETLEAIARALFKSWFVDFDPVCAKMRGCDPGLPQHLVDFFPKRLIESELGKIPEGWEVKTLEDLLELSYGKALKASSRHYGNIPVYGSNGNIGWHNKSLVPGPGIVVGRKGNPGVVTWVNTDFFPIDTTFFVVPKNTKRNLYFLFYALKGQNLPSMATDSVVPGLNRNLAYMNKQVMPADQIVEHFNRYVGTIFARSYSLEEESRTLATLRDALLPKLISGHLRVKDAETFLAGVL